MTGSGDAPPPARSAAFAKLLRRGASVREPPRRRSPEPDEPEASAFAANTTGEDEDSPLYATAFLDRTVSLLARSMALSKLTGAASPVAPSSYYIPANNQSDNDAQTGFSRAPLPTLDALRERAEAKIRNAGAGGRPSGLRRNNTVTGVGAREFGTELSSPRTETPVEASVEVVGDEPVVQLDRAEARTNLMRKLSARRLAPKSSVPAVLAVVGKQGQARPRSGSLGEISRNWTTGAPPVPQIPDSPFVPILSSAPTKPTLSRTTSAATERQRSPPTPLVLSPISRFANPTSPDWSGERDMRGRLQAQEFSEVSEDDDYNSTIGYAETPNANATPKMFSEFEWTPSRPVTGEQPRYDSDPPSPSSTSIRRPSVGPRISDTSPSSSDSVPLVLRRGSIPQHLFSGRFPSSMSTLSSIEAGDSRAHKTASFGIGAVEDTEIRRRGSSASSILALAGPMHRPSEAGFAFNESRLGAQRSFDTTSSSSSVRLPSSIDTRASNSSDQLEYVERRSPLSQEEQSSRKLREVELAAKVEQKRESGLMRSRDGAFPPPEAGYQFPSPPTTAYSRFSEDTSRSPYESIGPYDPPPIHSVPFAPHRSHPPPSRFQLRGPLSTIPHVTLPSSPILEQSVASSPVLPIHERPSSIEVRPRSIPTPVVKRLSQEPPLNSSLDRHLSVKSSRSGRTTDSRPPKSPSLDSVRSMEVGDGNRSGYSSSHEMKRDLSSSSAGSFSFEPRQYRVPADQLPANRILQQLDSILGTEQLESNEPSALDTPPRQLLLHAPVLQVVNANTVKDRHLFLFTDLLLIAKPIIHDDPITGQPLPSNLDNFFVVKSIVELRDLKLVAAEEAATDDAASKKRHPLLLAFVDRFANDPKRAIASLIQKGGLSNDGATIANLLFRNPDLNRNQLGSYFSARENKHTLRLYVERFRFAGVRLDDALRMFLMTVRLPHNLESAEYVLSVIASQWTEMNGTTGFDPSLTLSLVMAIMKLSDALHAGLSTEESLFSFPNSAITVDDFIAAFRERDTRLLVPEDLLTRIYASVRKEKIEQASDNSMFSMTPDIEATMEPAKLPTRLTYRTPSDLITITIPAPDAKFSIKLHGTDLKFEPNVLSFARSATQSFRVTGSALGVRAMVLIKYGANAPRYQGLPLNKAFSIERAFMQHTFQISFVNHLEVKRKYMFSTLSQDVRARWTKGLRERIESCVARPPPATRALLAGEMVAVQVLRDALIAPEDPPPLTSFAAPSPRLNTAAPRFGTAGPLMPHLAPPRSGRTGTGNSARSAQGILMRSNSVSKTYAAGIGKVEADLIMENGAGRKASTFSTARGGAVGGVREEENPFAKAGSEIALITEQNSLLPLVLSFLRAGASVAPHPVSVDGTAFQLRPLTPPPPPPSSTYPLESEPIY